MRTGLMEILKKDQHTFGLPNLLSFSRLLFLPLICYAISLDPAKGNWLALLLLGLSSLTDFFDGWVARQRNQFSELGRILDPVMDKLNITALMLSLSAWRGLPLWYAVLVILRDLLILIGSLFVIKKRQHVPQSSMIGKWALFVFLLVVLTYLMDWKPWNIIALVISIVLMPLTLVRYISAHRKLNAAGSSAPV
jgi:cardiolipin synthase (CMP-forming)